jgi:molybdate transport system permease protein
VETPPSLFAHYLGDTATQQAIGLSLVTSSITTLLVVVLGTPVAQLLSGGPFRGRALLEALIDLPTVLPPAVAGIALLMTFGRRGLLGPWLESLGVQIPFTPIAVVIAQAFVAASYYIKAASVGFAGVAPEMREAAAVLGASPLRIFFRVTAPLAWRGIAGGAALCWARALGEFGATIIFAGNYPGRTQTMPLAVYLGFEIDLGRALTLATILLALSFAVLIALRSALHLRAGFPR